MEKNMKNNMCVYTYVCITESLFTTAEINVNYK